MKFETIMRKYKFENRGVYFSRLEEEDLYEATRVGSKYVVRRESSCRGDVRVGVDICSSLKELVSVLRDMLDYYDCDLEEEKVQTYSIINPTTQHTLTTQPSLKRIQHFWNHIPRRKTSQLLLVDDITGEILKIKPKKG